MPATPSPPSTAAALAADLGGTTVRCGVVDPQGRVLAGLFRPSLASRPAPEIVANLLGGLEEALASSGLDPSALAGVGIGSPGIVYADCGVVHRAANFPAFQDLPLARLVGEHFSLPVRLHHDVDMAVLAERRLGAGRGKRHIACITVGTGIGMGLILNGRLYGGARAGAGNLGHLVLEADGDPGRWSARGYLEQRASGPAVRAAAIAAMGDGSQTSLWDACGGDRENLDARMVFEAARDGDALSAGIVDRVAHLLGVAIANLVSLLEPEVVIVGGGVAQAGDALFRPLRAVARAYVCPFLQDRLRIVPAQLGEDAGLIGAGLAVWEQDEA